MKPLITTILLTLFFALNIQEVFSQKNLQPGYIIDLKGDTITGKIELRNWINNPKAIVFVEGETNKTSTYLPFEIKKFSVASEVYVSAIVSLDKSPVNMAELGYNKDLELSTDTLFLQVLVGGKKNLYYYRDNKSPEQFFIENNGVIEWLVYKVFLSDAGVSTMEEKNNYYKQQLENYFRDCPEVQQKVAFSEYKQKELKKLFLDYYTCKNGAPLFEAKVEKFRIETGVLAGFSITNFKFSSAFFEYLSKADFKNSAAVSGGAFVNIIFPKKLKNMSLCNEIIYNSYKGEADYTQKNTPQDYTVNNTKIGFSYIKLNTMLRYTIPVSKFFIYLNAGVSNGMIINKTNYRKRGIYYYSPVPETKEEEAISNLRNHEQSFIVGSGVRVSKFSFEVRYENGNGMSYSSALGAIIKRWYFFAGYRF